MVPIVVNPLLWYVHEQLKNVAVDTLVKVLSKFYSAETIEEAKTTIYDNFTEEKRPRKLQRKILRQGPHKSENNIKDIIDILHEMAASVGFEKPIFVTANTDFPPLSLAEVDVSSMQYEILAIKKELNQFKETKASEMRELSQMKRDIQELISTIVSKENAPKQNMTANEMSACTPSSSSVNISNKASNNHKKSYAQALLKNNLDKDSQFSDIIGGKQEGDWKTFKKTPKKTSVGKNKGSHIKSVTPPAVVFLSRLDPSTKEEEIDSFVKNQFSELKKVECKQLKTRYETYSSFKVSLYGVSFKDSLLCENWPEGILVKRYFPPTNQTNQENSAVPSSTANAVTPVEYSKQINELYKPSKN